MMAHPRGLRGGRRGGNGPLPKTGTGCGPKSTGGSSEFRERAEETARPEEKTRSTRRRNAVLITFSKDFSDPFLPERERIDGFPDRGFVLPWKKEWV